MASVPGGRINGKFKTYQEMTTEELEQLVFESEMKKAAVLLAIALFFGFAAVIYLGGVCG